MNKRDHSAARHQKSLAKKIIYLLIILVMAGLIEISLGFILLHRYRTEIEDMESTVTDAYITRTNQIFSMLNTSIRSLLFDSSEIKNITDAYINSPVYQTDSIASVLIQNDSILTLKDTFLSLSKNYGNQFNFFFYSNQNHKLTEYGGCEYDIRKPFIDHLQRQIDQGTLQYTKEGKWFLDGEYICTIYNGPRGIAGAWIRASDLASNILSFSPARCSSINIYNPDTDTEIIFRQKENGTISAENFKTDDSKRDFSSLTNARFSLLFKIDAAEYENTLLYPMLFLLLIIIYLIFVILSVIYVRKNILNQVNFFYDNLMEFKNTAMFNENSGFVEFAETGRVLNKMADEVQKLKIDIYEKQLEKQKIELDYAQLQIRPHFYINCLNIIHSMAQVNLMNEIQEITFQVSVYLRYIFKKSMEPVTLEEELNFTRNYLRVLECMNDTAYRCQMNVRASLGKYLVPPLIIQTFVENAVKHNMDIITEDKFQIEILAETQAVDNKVNLEIFITDNGHGFDQELLKRLNDGTFTDDNSGHHIGIRNAGARLKLLYGDKAGVRFSNNPEGGACVHIVIPADQEEME